MAHMAQEENEALVESETTSFNQGGGRAERFEDAVNAIINRHSKNADRASFWKWYNTFYTWTNGGITRRHAFLKCFSFNQDVNNQFNPADYRWVYKNNANKAPVQAANKEQVARYFWGGPNTHRNIKPPKSRYYPEQNQNPKGPIPEKLQHKYKNNWEDVNGYAKSGTPCWKFIAYYFDKKFVHGQDGLKYFIDILNRAWSEAQQNQAAVNQFVQAQNNVPDESKSGGADEEHDAIPPADDNGNQNQPLIGAKQEFFNEYDVDGQNEYAPVINHDYGYNHYYYPQQQQPQLLLSPQVIPIQYGVNGLNNMNNNGVNHDYYVSNQWLFVLLPILLIAACLFGIICMFLMGFGGLFCYREGKKARVIDERNGFYHKLPQKDDVNANKRDRGLVHYDESV